MSGKTKAKKVLTLADLDAGERFRWVNYEAGENTEAVWFVIDANGPAVRVARDGAEWLVLGGMVSASTVRGDEPVVRVK